jgi:hypothetical protein
LHINEEYIVNRVYGRYGNEIMNNGCKEWMEWRKYSRVVVDIVVGIGWGGEAATAMFGMYWPALREVVNHPACSSSRAVESWSRLIDEEVFIMVLR